MDYEKKYNEALNDMRAIYPNLKGDAKLAVEHAFPELRESEDERIRKGLVKLLTVASEAYLVESTGIKKDSYLAYLEKQKGPENTSVSVMVPSCWEVEQKEQKPVEWSKEDEKRIQRICDFLWKNRKGDTDTIYQIEKDADWLKSLHPSWKPTYEQLEALRKAVNKLADTEVADSVRLSIMYDHLKELM